MFSHEKGMFFLSEEIKKRSSRCVRLEFTSASKLQISLNYGSDYATISIKGAFDGVDSDFELIGDKSTLDHFKAIGNKISTIDILDYLWSLDNKEMKKKIVQTIFESGEYSGRQRKSDELRNFLRTF